MRRLLCVISIAAAFAASGCKNDKEAGTAGTPASGGDTSGATAAAGGATAPAGTFKQENTPDNLKALVERLLQSMAARDEATFGTLLKGLQPDEAAVKKGLRDGAPADAVAKVLANAREVPTIGTGLSRAEVHGATGAEIVAQSTPASGHFSGNDRTAAEELLRPDTTYYNVLVSGSGADGKTLHLFFWDGAGWKMLGHIRE